MGKGSIEKRMAEWLLAKLSSRPRASEIVGDLLERPLGRGEFAWTILRIAFAMVWLRAFGAAAFLCTLALSSRAHTAFAGPHIFSVMEANLQMPHVPAFMWLAPGFSLWDRVALICVPIDFCLWMSTWLVATWLPNGWRHSKPAFLTAGVIALISWTPGIPGAVPALLCMLCFVSIAILFRRDWRAAWLVTMAGAAAIAAWIVSMLALFVSGHAWVERQFGTHSIIDLDIVAGLLTLLTAPVIALVCLRKINHTAAVGNCEAY